MAADKRRKTAGGPHGKFQKWLQPDNLTRLRAWARAGYSNGEICGKIGISESTFYAWLQRFPEIAEAVSKDRDVVDDEVEESLLEAAKGGIKQIRKPIKLKRVIMDGGKRKEEEYIDYALEEIYVPPNVTAQIFWLKCRKAEQWRENRKQEVADDGGVTIVDDIP